MSAAVLTAQVVLAHGGGAPEALAVGLPIALLVAFAVFERRARRADAAAAAATDDPVDAADGEPDSPPPA